MSGAAALRMTFAAVLAKRTIPSVLSPTSRTRRIKPVEADPEKLDCLNWGTLIYMPWAPYPSWANRQTGPTEGGQFSAIELFGFNGSVSRITQSDTLPRCVG